MNAILPFYFDDQPVRVTDRDGVPWFVLSDVCQALGIANVGNAAARLDDDERDSVRIADAIDRQRETVVVSESGVYALVFTSRKEAAKRFKRWVTHDVLPAIRQTGQFGGGIPAMALQDPAAMREILLAYVDRVIESEAMSAQLTEKASALDRLANSTGSLCVTDAAKSLGMPPKKLFHWLAGQDWIYRRGDGGAWTAYQTKLNTGLLEVKVTRLTRIDGPAKITEQVKITPKGLARLAELLETTT